LVLKLGAVALMWRFPIDAPMQARIRHLILKREDRMERVLAA